MPSDPRPAPPRPPAPHLTDLLSTIPSPLTVTLVQLSAPVARLRRIAEISSWQSPPEESWLALAAWWAVCLLADPCLRYTLPLAILSFLALASWKLRPHPPPPTTEATLQKTMYDLDKIRVLMPVPNSLSIPPIMLLLRATTILYIPYLLLTYFVRLRVLVALMGSIILTWRAPWAPAIRHGFWRSAWIRRATYKLWFLLSGEPSPQPIRPDFASAVASSDTKINDEISSVRPAVTSLRFLFTVHENQRWWMGLDWTAALLPQERPAWSSASEQPVTPPSAFVLPLPTIVYMASDKGRTKREATWRWEEDEWRVLVKKEGTDTSRVERPLPSLKEDTPPGARLLKAAGMLKEPSSNSERNNDHSTYEKGEIQDEEPYTDGDGWIYSDNKWESKSGKTDIGKFTRYRRWTRIAVLTETVEFVGPGDLGIHREVQQQPVSGDEPSPTSSTCIASDSRSSIDSEGERVGIRQRLRAVVT